MMNRLQGIFNPQVVRFTLMGAISTTIMYLFYILLNIYLPYQWSYFISYIVTVILSYVLNCYLVFHTPMSIKTFLQFPLVYVVQYVMSALGIEIFVRLGMSATYAPLIVIISILPLTFVLSRLVILKQKN